MCWRPPALLLPSSCPASQPWGGLAAVGEDQPGASPVLIHREPGWTALAPGQRCLCQSASLVLSLSQDAGIL